MKKKLLSLLLVIAIMVTSVSMGFGAIGVVAVAVSSKDVGVSFSVENKSLTGSSANTNLVATVGSNYKVRIRSVTPTVINSSAGTATVSVDYNANSTVLTNGGKMGVSISNVGSNANTAIRYEINYDILDSSGKAIWTNKTNLAYGLVSQDVAHVGPVGTTPNKPGTYMRDIGTNDNFYFEWKFETFSHMNSKYVQVNSGDALGYQSNTYAHTRLGTPGSKKTTPTVTGNTPSNMTFSTITWPEGKLCSNFNTTSKKSDGVWVSAWSITESSYYSFSYDVAGNDTPYEDANYNNSVEIYYLKRDDKEAASTALEGCANLQKDNYTAASWATLEAAMDKAAQVAYSVSNANEGYKIACQNGSSAGSAVTNAKNGLVFEKANWEDFKNANLEIFEETAPGSGKVIIKASLNEVTVYTYAAGKDILSTTTYGKETVAKYKKAETYAYVAWFVSGPLADYNKAETYRYDQHIVDEYVAKIRNDFAALPLADAVYTYLDEAIAEYERTDGDMFIADKWTNYEAAINSAKSLSRSYKIDSQSEINARLETIIEKKNQLVYEDANTTELYIQLNNAEEIYNEYDKGNLLHALPDFDTLWNYFEEAYDTAFDVRYYKINQQDDVDKAAKDLEAAIKALSRYRILDTTELRRVCGLDPEYDSSKYVPESYNLWNTLRIEGSSFISKATPKDGKAEKTYENYDEMERLITVIQNAYDSLEKIKADFTELDKAVARIPSDDVLALYKDEYVDAIKDIALTIDYGATFDEQDKVDEITDNLNAAIDELTEANKKPAGYTEVEEAIAEAEAIYAKNITTNYNEVVKPVIDAVDWTKKIDKQADVDAMAAAIREAIKNLEYILADYTEVEEAIAEAEAVANKEWYANYGKVTQAIKAVDWTVTIDKQPEVDAMAEAIREAIKNLKLADADYSGIRDAIALYNAQAPLTDFETDSVAAVDQAIGKVQYGLKANEQNKVDAWEDEIREAIDNMVLLPADYSRLRATKTYAESFDPAKYTKESYKGVTDAINAINWELNCRQNAEMNAQINAINNAVVQLKLLPADYTKVDEAIVAAREACTSGAYPYTQESIDAVEAVIASINRDYDIEHQADVDAYIVRIQTAVMGLTYIRADYKTLDDVKAEYDGLQRDLYASLSAVDAYVAKIDWNKTIDKQAEVNTYAKELAEMLKNLEYAPADYTAVDNAITIFNAINREYYEAYDIAAVEVVINSVVRDLKKNEQDRVNQMAQDINDAIDELTTRMKKADLDALNDAVTQALAKYNEMSETGYGIDDETRRPLENLLARANDYNEDTTIDNQPNIDQLTADIIEATANLEFVFTIILDGSGLVIKDGYIYGFEEGTTSAKAKELIKFVGAAEIKITETKNGFGTGTIIQFISTKDGSLIATYTVLVFGDANGDAVIDMFDAAYIIELVNEGSQPSDMLLRVLDICNDKTLDVTDVTMMIALANMDATLRQDGTMRTY